jgi:hypothetical protein
MRTRLTRIAVLLFALVVTACGGDDPPPPTATAPPPATVTATATPEATATFVPPTATLVPPTPEPAACPNAVDWSQASAYVGQHVRVIGPVVGGMFAEQSSGQPTFLDMGRTFPDAGRFTVVIWIEDRGKFPPNPETYYRGHTVCVTGTVELFRGSPQIVARSPEQLEIQ